MLLGVTLINLFRYTSDTDHTFAQLNIFSAEDNAPLGLINWFSAHPVSVNNTNQMISSDHKGAASVMMEKMMNPGVPSGQVII